VARGAALTDGFRVGFLISVVSLLCAGVAALLVRSTHVRVDPDSEAQTAIAVTEIEGL
jgi:hypothetical protein